jgi:exopolysaccharide production protein ExoZ
LPQSVAWPAILVGFAFLLTNEALGNTDMRSCMWGIPAMVIVYSAISIDFSKLPTIGWLNYLGDASYAIYITHAFSLAFLRIVCGVVGIDILQHGSIFIVLCLVLSSIGGGVVHELTTPGRWKRKKLAAA